MRNPFLWMVFSLFTLRNDYPCPQTSPAVYGSWSSRGFSLTFPKSCGSFVICLPNQWKSLLPAGRLALLAHRPGAICRPSLHPQTLSAGCPKTYPDELRPRRSYKGARVPAKGNKGPGQRVSDPSFSTGSRNHQPLSREGLNSFYLAVRDSEPALF